MTEEKPLSQREGTYLYERSKNKLATSYWDNLIYRKVITQKLKCVPRDAKLLEIGSGDGRITRYLIELGFINITIVESNEKALNRFLKAGIPKNIELSQYNCPIQKAVFRDRQFDVIIAIEVLYYLNEDFEVMLDLIGRWLAPEDGLLIHSEPTFEGALIYSISKQDWMNVNRLANNKERREAGQWVRTFEAKEIDKIYQKKKGLNIIWKEPIPIITPLFFTHSHYAGDRFNLLIKLQSYNLRFPRCMLYVVRKRQ